MEVSRPNIRVESAETGEVFLLRREPTIEQLKMELGFLQPISSDDQILLCGPPFKTFDTQYRPDMVLDNKRIFLFNRRIIVDESLRPTFRPRSSQEPPQPEPISGTVDASHLLEVVKDEALVNRFVEYIQFFRSELHRNRFYENYVQQATLACKSSIARLKVQLDAISAASSNMQDVFNAAAKTDVTLQGTFGQQQELHRTLLDNFEANLEQLKQIPLHPSFLQAYELYKAQYHPQPTQEQKSQWEGPNAMGRGSGSALSTSWVTHHSDLYDNAAISEIAFPPLQTLYDCIPIDRERKFYQHCLENDRHLSQQFTIVQANYSAVKYSVDNLAKLPVDATTVETWAQQLAREEDNYARGLEQLRSNYVMVHEALTQSIPQDAAALERLLAKCTECRHEYEATWLSTSTAATSTAPISASPSQRTWLELDAKTTVQRLQNWQQTLEHHQELVTRALYTLVRQINAVHNDIQGKLRRDIDWMRKLSAPTGQKSEYLVHLQSLAQLPQNYAALVLELHRRQRATRQLQRQLQPAKQWLARRREQEIVRREQFLREAGLHLPPIFLKLFPSLKDKPPSIVWEVPQDEPWWAISPATDADVADETDGDGDGDSDDDRSPFRSEVELQKGRNLQQEHKRVEQMTREKDEAILTLQTQLDALTETLADLQKQHTTMVAQTEEMTHEKDDTIRQLKSQVEVYQQEQQTAAQRAEALASQHEQLLTKVALSEEVTREKDELQAQVEELSAALSDQQQQQHTTMVAQSEEAASERATVMQQLQSQVEEYQQRHREAVQCAEVFAMQTEQLAVQMDQLTHEKDEAIQQLQSQVEAHREAMQRTEALAAQLERLSVQVDQVKQEKDAVIQQLTEALTEQQNLHTMTLAQTDEMTHEKDDALHQLQTLADSLADQQTKHTALLQQTEQVTREKDATIRQLQSQVEELAETLAKQHEHIQRTEQSERVTSEKDETIRQLQTELETLRQRCQEATQFAEELATQLLQTPPSLHPEGYAVMAEGYDTGRSTKRAERTVSTQPPLSSLPLSPAEAEIAHAWDDVVAYFTRALKEPPLAKLREESISIDEVVTRLSRQSVLADEVKVVELATQLQAASTSTLGRIGSGEGSDTEINEAPTFIPTLHRLLCVTSYRLALPVLAFMDFRVGDNVLFLPAKLLDGRQVWMAFNSGCPFHFLDELSLEAFIKRSKNSSAPRTSIIGRLIFLEHHVVAEGTDPRTHRYNLQPGTKFAICHIEPLKKPSSSSAS